MMNRPFPQETQRHAQLQRQEQQRHAAPRSSQDASPTMTAKTSARPAEKQRLARDEHDFNRLLNDEQNAAPLLPIAALAPIDPDTLLRQAQEPQAASPTPAAMLWQIIEPPLSESLATQEAFPARFSLLLPQLGEVNAQVNALPGGEMTIALGFSDNAFQWVRGSEKQCAESLARRMGQRVRLRFQRLDVLS